jgi:hypothetical protein
MHFSTDVWISGISRHAPALGFGRRNSAWCPAADLKSKP